MRQLYSGKPFEDSIATSFLDDPIDLTIIVQYQMLYRCKILHPEKFTEQTGGIFPADAIAELLRERLQKVLSQRFADGITEEETVRPPMELLPEVLEAVNRTLEESIGMEVVQLRFNEYGMSDEDRSYIDMGRRLAKEGAPSLGSHLMWGDSRPEPLPEAAIPADEPAADTAQEPEPALEPAPVPASMPESEAVSEPAPEPEATAAAVPQPNRWICPCGRVNERKFCQDCGTPRTLDRWICGDCGSENQGGKFCTFCGRAVQ